MQDGKPENFTLTCQKCGSANVRVVNTLDSDREDGAWGSVMLVCGNCGETEQIAAAA